MIKVIMILLLASCNSDACRPKMDLTKNQVEFIELSNLELKAYMESCFALHRCDIFNKPSQLFSTCLETYNKSKAPRVLGDKK